MNNTTTTTTTTTTIIIIIIIMITIHVHVHQYLPSGCLLEVATTVTPLLNNDVKRLKIASVISVT